jgi:hypothetical protein
MVAELAELAELAEPLQPGAPPEPGALAGQEELAELAGLIQDRQVATSFLKPVVKVNLVAFLPEYTEMVDFRFVVMGFVHQLKFVRLIVHQLQFVVTESAKEKCLLVQVNAQSFTAATMELRLGMKLKSLTLL